MWVIRWCAGALDRFFGSPWGFGDRGLSAITGGRRAITDMLRPEADSRLGMSPRPLGEEGEGESGGESNVRELRQ